MDSERNVLVREYRTPWTYWRDSQRLSAGGWQAVSTLERRPARDWLHFATCGLIDYVRGPERLVTYVAAAPAAAAPAPMRSEQVIPPGSPLAPALSRAGARVRRAARRAAERVPDPAAVAGVTGVAPQPATSLAA